MKEIFVKIIVWLGVLSVLTVVAMGLWMVCDGGQSTESLKWLQFVQMTATFLLPPLLCAWRWDADRRPLRWLGLDKGASGRTFALAVLIMVCAIPGINLLADLNSRVVFPECMAGLEIKLKAMEEQAAILTERFLQADNFGMLLINLGLMAILPALAEELTFRGTLQQILTAKRSSLAIWITAFVFSAVHMQFYGFVPRMLMGALFGYLFVWSGSLWVPIVMHLTNNSIAILTYYLLGENTAGKNYADTFGAGTTWWAGILSLLVVSGLLWITYRDLQGYDRRTRTQ